MLYSLTIRTDFTVCKFCLPPVVVDVKRLSVGTLNSLLKLCFVYFFAVSFDNYMQHDAHEFLNYLLNTIADLLQGKKLLCYCVACN